MLGTEFFNSFSFDYTGLSGADYTLSYDSDIDQSRNPSSDTNEVNREPDDSKNVHPIRSMEVAESENNFERGVTLLKALVRYDIMQQVSSIISELVAIDLKYSKFVQIEGAETKRPTIETSELNDNDECGRSPLENLHAFTIAELNEQLSLVQNFIRDLDEKYSLVVDAVHNRIQKLERCNAELFSEIERLRRFY